MSTDFSTSLYIGLETFGGNWVMGCQVFMRLTGRWRMCGINWTKSFAIYLLKTAFVSLWVRRESQTLRHVSVSDMSATDKTDFTALLFCRANTLLMTSHHYTAPVWTATDAILRQITEHRKLSFHLVQQESWPFCLAEQWIAEAETKDGCEGDWWRQRNYSCEWCAPRGPGNNGGSGVTDIRRRRRRIHLIPILYETDPHLPAWFPTKWNVSVAFCARQSGNSCAAHSAAIQNLAWFPLPLIR